VDQQWLGQLQQLGWSGVGSLLVVVVVGAALAGLLLTVTLWLLQRLLSVRRAEQALFNKRAMRKRVPLALAAAAQLHSLAPVQCAS